MGRIGPSISDLKIVIGDEREPPVSRRKGGVVNEVFSKVDAYGATLAVRQQWQIVKNTFEEESDLESKVEGSGGPRLSK